MPSSRSSSLSAKSGLVTRQSRVSLEGSLLGMQKYNENGSTSVVVAVISSILLVAAGAFAVWAFMGRQDFKNNTDQKINTAVTAAEAAQAVRLKAQFAEESKNPNKTYLGSPTYGSVSFKYPKTWSAYIDETSSNEPINGYFYPDKVPGLQSGTAYALRVELLNNSYSQTLQQLNSLVKQGKLKASAYVPPKMAGKPNLQPGTRFDGMVNQNQAGPQQGSMVVIQVRDKTLKISTQSLSFVQDYNNSVLANLTFVP
jgi:type II secretory pathway pseudopilin PulG